MSEPSPPLPDLQIFVRRVSPADPLQLVFEVRAADQSLGLNFKEYGPIRLGMSPEEYRETLFSDIKYLILEGEDNQRKAARKIANKGGQLFEKLLPEDLRSLLWSLRETAASLQIVSDDLHIPWELLRLRARDSGRWTEGPFLCEAFALTRWLRQIPEAHTLPVRRLALVVPKTSGLPSSGGEREDILGLHGNDREVTEIPALYEQVLAAMATGDYDAWHFGAHGGEITPLDRNADLWPLELDDHPLVPEDLGSDAANLGALRPLVFFNSCNIGRGGHSLAGLGGWPAALLEARAGGFIGALWGIRDSRARRFAQTFYRSFLTGTPIGEAVRQARLSIKDGDPTWLAYTVFAHPLATSTGKPVSLDTAPLAIPLKEWKPKISPPGALLQAEYGIVPFHGRDQEMEDLRTWCRDDQTVGVRLYTGQGGMGKTRLALEVAREFRMEGWRTGFLRPEDLSSPEEAWKKVSRPGGKVLVVVDYAETRRDLLIPLLRGMIETETGPYRLILLARAALDWWEQLKTERNGVGEILSGPATSRHSLAPLAFDTPARVRSYELAKESFSARLTRPRPEGLPNDLEAKHFERVLLLHMNALINVEGDENRIKGEDGILDQILYRERRHWRERAKDAGLPRSFEKGVGRAMATITLGGGVAGEEEAVEVLRGLSFFEGQPGDILIRTARLLHEVYPGAAWIEPVMPDLLGEHLVQRELEAGADELFNLTLGPTMG